jgi:polar amino acid transport system substrate-binding protein
MIASCASPAAAPATTAPAAQPTKAAAAEPTKAPEAKPTEAPAAAGPNIDRIKKAGKLVILMDATFAPMEYKDESGKIVGMDADLAAEFAKTLGVTAEYQNVNWDGIFVALDQGKGDMVESSVTITDERKLKMDFSEPYYLAGQVISIPATTNDIKGPADLKGKKVAVQIDTTGQEAAQKIEGLTDIVKFDGGAEVMLAVEQGKVDAAIMDSVVALAFIKDHSKVKAVDRKPFTTEPYGVAFKKGSPDLVKAYNDWLAAAK